jgi:hypothetical protein
MSRLRENLVKPGLSKAMPADHQPDELADIFALGVTQAPFG